MVEAADLIGQMAAAVDQHQIEARQFVEGAGEDQPGGADRGLPGVALKIGQIEVVERPGVEPT